MRHGNRFPGAGVWFSTSLAYFIIINAFFITIRLCFVIDGLTFIIELNVVQSARA